jgi:hypothetical protein
VKTTRKAGRGHLRRLGLLACAIVAGLTASGFERPNVRIESTDSVGPRSLEKQTKAAVVRDYLEAWQSLTSALGENRPDLLDPSFVGVAREKLADTIREQQEAGIRTRYRDRSHDLTLVFYSPEGLSVELLDTVEYDVELLAHDKTQAVQPVRAHYVAVLTPTEVRWKVRFFQAEVGE